MLERPEPKKQLPTPDLRYASLTREDADQKLAKLAEILGRHQDVCSTENPEDSEGGPPVELRRGYFFFPEINQRIVDGEDYRDASKEAGQAKYFQFPEHFRKERQRAIKVLAQEYKIHLMPKPEYVPFILNKLFEAMEGDEELKDSVAQLKVINDDKKIRDEIMPSIVIYAQLGKEYAQTVLDKLSQYLEGCEALGADQTPRFNQKVNGLIYYAQSGGDWKNEYAMAMRAMPDDMCDEAIFEPDMIHFKGDYHLDLPKPKESMVASSAIEKSEISERVQEVPLAGLRGGDVIRIETQNSSYQLQVYFNTETGNQSLRVVGGTGSLVGREGEVVSAIVKVGEPFVFGAGRTSEIKTVSLERSVHNAVRGISDLNPGDQVALDTVRDALKGILNK